MSPTVGGQGGDINGFFSMVAITSDCDSPGIGNNNRTSHHRVSTTKNEHGTAAKAKRDIRSGDGTARRSDRQAIRGSESLVY